MGENKFFRWGEFVIRGINNSVLVWFCHVAKSLLEKKFEFPFILDRKFSFFPFVNGGYISAESNEIEERQELSNFLPQCAQLISISLNLTRVLGLS